MATGVTVYQSTDASAPTVTGQAGSLTTLLDAVLVNGYGSKAAAGWTIYKTGTNKRVYQQGGGAQLFIRVRDDAGGTGGAKEALIRGAEGASDVDTLTNGMPTSVQSALTDNSLVARKSATADATTRAWIIIADNRTIYMFVLTGDSAGVYLAWAFGDFYSNIVADPYRNVIIARTAENSATVSVDKLDSIASASSAAVAGHFIQRDRNQTSPNAALACNARDNINNTAGTNVVGGASMIVPLPFPNPEDGGFYLQPLYLADPTTLPVNSVRGWLRGFWSPCHLAANFVDGQQFGGVGNFAGRTFQVIKASGNTGFYVMEISDTWDTSS